MKFQHWLEKRRLYQFKTVLAVLFLQICFSATASAGSKWPTEVIEKLESWKNITSISYDESGSEISGILTKRWGFKNVSGNMTLTEQIPLTKKAELEVPTDPTQGGAISWIYGTIDLSGTMSAEPFVMGNSSIVKSITAIQIDQKIIVLSFNDDQGNEKFRLLLMPSKSTPTTNHFLVGNRQLPGISKTPDSGQTISNAIMKKYNFSIQDFPGPKYYLNHPIKTGSRRIVVSPEFPDSYIPVLNSVIKKWNSLFGHNYYSFFKKENLNMVDCLSSDLLCIQWTGGERFTWTEYSGTTDLAVDPGSGSVLGGIIYIHNNADPTKARDGTTDELSKILKPANLFDVAVLFSNFVNYSHIWREQSDDLVAWLLLHEMGHFLGWDHNFAGAWNGTLTNPGDTVMGYPPFPLAGRLNNLGPLDIEKFKALYVLNSQAITSPYCGDLDIAPFLDKETGTARKLVPECFMWTAGNTTDWLASQATVFGNWGTEFDYSIYQQLKPPSWFGSYAVSIGYIAQNSKSAENRQKAVEYLCKQQARDSSISGTLYANLRFQLRCQ